VLESSDHGLCSTGWRDENIFILLGKSEEKISGSVLIGLYGS
jgi:hypothetical protein